MKMGCGLRLVIGHLSRELVQHLLVSTVPEAKLILKTNLKDETITAAHSLRIRDERLSASSGLLASNPNNISWFCK